jgi:uncharacterized protein YndB with AHSA1/START domain
MFWKKKPEEGDTQIIEIREGKAEIFIEAPPEKVWDVISDVRNYDKWVKFFKARLPDHLERIEKAGDYSYYETSILGIPIKGKTVTIERIAPQRSAFYLVSAYRGGGEFLLEPVAEGTRVHYTIWSEIPSTYLGKLVDRALLARRAQEKMQEHLNRLKAYVEGTPLP